MRGEAAMVPSGRTQVKRIATSGMAVIGTCAMAENNCGAKTDKRHERSDVVKVL
jgi:hypothetical protein